MKRRTFSRWLLASLVTLLAVLVGGYAWLQTAAGKRWLADWIEAVTSTPERRLEIGALEGAIPFAPVATGVRLSDASGPWLKVDRAAVQLDPKALIGGVARFVKIEVSRLTVLRMPPASDPETEGWQVPTFTPPRLPVALKIDRLSVAEVALGAAIVGEPARFRVQGTAGLGDPMDGLALDLAIRRTDDTKGVFIAQMLYVPDTTRLTMMLRADEPEGGILARLMGLPALPALTIDLSGDGMLDDWKAELWVDGGNGLQLKAPVAITAGETGHRVLVEAKGHFAALAGDALRPLVDPETSLSASMLVRADDKLRIDKIELAGGFGATSLTGELDLGANTIDVELGFLPAAPERFARLIDAASWGALRLSAVATGPLLEPHLNLSLAAHRVVYGEIALESFVSTIDAAITGPLTDARSSIAIIGEFLVDGLDPGIDLPAGLLEPELRIATGVSITPAGRVVVDRLTVDAPAVRLSATGTAEGWGTESAAFVGTLDVPDLSPIRFLPDKSVTGEAATQVSANWDGTRVAVRSSAELEHLSTNIAAVGRLLGASPRLALAGSYGVNDTISVERLALSGKGVEMSASGAIGSDARGIDWELSLADLPAVNSALTGALRATGRITGTLDDPAATARITLTEAVLAGYTVSDGHINAAVTGLAKRPVGDVTLEARISGLPAHLTAELQVEEEGVIEIDALALRLASLVAEGAVTLNTAGTASGKIAARVGNLADLAPLMGKPLSGQFNAELSLSQSDDRQMADVKASAVSAGIPGSVEVERAHLTLQLSDALGAADMLAQLQVEGILAGDLALDRTTVTAKGNLDGLTVALDLSDELLDLNTQAALAFSERKTQIEVVELRARYADTRATLAGPTRVTLAGDGLLVEGLILQIEGGRLLTDGRYGDATDLVLSIDAIPLKLVRLAAPNLDLSGRLDGRLRLTGTRVNPRASAELTASDVTLAAMRQAGVPGANMSMALGWGGGTLSLDSTITGDFGGPLTASATLDVPPDPVSGLPTIGEGSSLTGRLAGNLPLGLVNDLLAARGDRVAGNLAFDLQLLGRLADPRIGGSLSLTQGSYRSVLTGVSLDDILLRVNGDGDWLTIAELSAKAPNGGTVRGGGSIGIDPHAGFPTDIWLGFNDALIINSDIVSAKVRGKVGAAGALTRSLDVGGRLTILEAEIQLPERLPPSIPTLEVVEINVPPELKERRPMSPAAADDIGPPLQILLDLTIDAPGRIFVRGRGLDAETSGEVTVRGKAETPDISGGFQLRRGHLNALGRRFNFNEGVVNLPEDGSMDPVVRFVARTRTSDASTQITVSGRASAPQILLESMPELPQDEILARILFGKRSSSLTALESVQLARSALQLTGMGAGPGVLDGVRRGLGVDLIDIQQLGADTDGATLNLRRRIREKINLGVKQGLGSDSGGATVEIELTPNILLETEVGSDSTGGTGVRMEWEY